MKETFVTVERDPNELRERASQAFDAKFRAEMADACMSCFLPISHEFNCCCPEGAVVVKKKGLNVIKESRITDRRPVPNKCREIFGFEYDQHRDFQLAFDVGRDRGTPEAALGLLYRLRYS